MISICDMLAPVLFFAAFGAGSAGADGAGLLRAAARGDADAIRAEIAAGTPVDTRNTKGETALLVATHQNHVDAARVLIGAGADVNAKDSISDSAYLYAGARGHLEILRMTLENGADLASLNRFGGTALIPAAERGHVETVATLIAAGVDLDHVNKLGWTALMEAVVLADGGPRHRQIVTLLLNAGADPNIPDFEGVTPLQHARARGQDAMAALIAEGGGR